MVRLYSAMALAPLAKPAEQAILNAASREILLDERRLAGEIFLAEISAGCVGCPFVLPQEFALSQWNVLMFQAWMKNGLGSAGLYK